MNNNTSPKSKKALILSGGGVTGWMFEVGALAALDDFFVDGFCINDFDIFVGASAGSSLAALLTNGVRPRDMLDAILRDKKVGYNFRQEDIYSFATDEYLSSFKKIFTTFFPILKHYYRNRNKFNWIDLFYFFQENLPAGIFTNKNLEEFLAKNLSQRGSTNNFRKLRKRLFIPAVNIDNAEYTVFGDDQHLDTPISKAVAASSAIPLVFLPVKIDGKDYIDGSVGKVAHLNIAVSYGADLILTINPTTPINNDRDNVCLRSFSEKCAGLKDKGISFVADQVLRINTEVKMFLGMRRYILEYPQKDFLLIQPAREEINLFNYNMLSLSGKYEILNCGYFTTARELLKNFDQLTAMFAKHNIKVSLEKFEKEQKIRWNKMPDGIVKT